MCEETRGALRLYPNSYDYPEIQTITEFITEEQLYGIHKACDCFITTSRGESWCQPAIEAMSFGNKVIATDGTGTTFFLNKSNGWRIDSVAEPVICYNPPMNNIYNARENWMEPLTNSIREKMRAAFDEGKGKSKECTETVKRFSYKKVAKSMVDTI
jgi:glycosyltransferase involved in cell wall biosynthesis